jgi:hypothetical protein
MVPFLSPLVMGSTSGASTCVSFAVVPALSSRKESVLRRDFASAKPRESLPRNSVAARGITVHSSRQYIG